MRIMRWLTLPSGIGLETSILFAKEGANVLMTDISQEALDKALAKVKQLVPDAGRVETRVAHPQSPTYQFYTR
jgi:NAD(P)-dependent dehydrogenase (short-subunit alcohol dehydrogenase family)